MPVDAWSHRLRRFCFSRDGQSYDEKRPRPDSALLAAGARRWGAGAGRGRRAECAQCAARGGRREGARQGEVASPGTGRAGRCGVRST